MAIYTIPLNYIGSDLVDGLRARLTKDNKNLSAFTIDSKLYTASIGMWDNPCNASIQFSYKDTIEVKSETVPLDVQFDEMSMKISIDRLISKYKFKQVPTEGNLTFKHEKGYELIIEKRGLKILRHRNKEFDSQALAKFAENVRVIFDYLTSSRIATRKNIEVKGEYGLLTEENKLESPHNLGPGIERPNNIEPYELGKR